MHQNEIRDKLQNLGAWEKRILTHMIERRHVARNPNEEFDAQLTLGQRLADRVAAFGGSWTFIALFLLAMVIWMWINIAAHRPFDPYPFILLNLVLSCLAAVQAPVILMSQNRQAAKDRMDAQHDYEVNLKAELEVLGLHTKLDEMRQQTLADIRESLARQVAVLEQIEGLIREGSRTRGGPGAAAVDPAT